jgi:hypothetical protein
MHAFKFKLSEKEGSGVLTAWARVIRGKKPVDLLLTADDARRSIALKGLGNTQLCTMALCAKRHAAAFPHPVEGYIDWTYSRAFVVTHVSKRTGFPSVCVVYRHRDDIAKINDSGHGRGQRKLLRYLEEKGDRVIHLLPAQMPKVRPGRARGKNTGERGSRVAHKGARLRFAVAQMGGV